MYLYGRLCAIGQQINENNTDVQCARYFLRNIAKLDSITAQSCQNEAGVSKASLHRFLKNGGFSGFSQLTHTLKSEISQFSSIPASDDEHHLKKESLVCLTEDLRNAETVLFYGDPREIHKLHHTMFVLEKNGINACLLTTWNIKNMYTALNQLKTDDVFINIDSFWTLSHAMERSMNYSWCLNLKDISEGNYHKYFLDKSMDGKEAGFHTIETDDKSLDELDTLLAEKLEREPL